MQVIPTEPKPAWPQTQSHLARDDWQLAQVVAAANAFRFDPNLERRLEEIVQGVQRALGSGDVALHVIDSTGQPLQINAHTGLGAAGRQLLQDTVPAWEEIAHWMQEKFRIGRCYLIPQEFSPEQSFPTLLQALFGGVAAEQDEHLDDRPSRAILLVPIEPRQGQVIGLICVETPREGPQPDQTTLHTLEMFANLAALVIENAHLYEQGKQELAAREQTEEALRRLNEAFEKRVAERTAELVKLNAELAGEVNQLKQTEADLLHRNRELLSLQAAATATTYSLDLQFVLETVTWELASLLGVEGCLISKWSPEENTLAVIAQYGSAGWEEKALIEIYHLENHALRSQVLQERSAQQLVISQPDIDLDEWAHMQSAHHKSLLILPMIFQDRVVGLVELTDSQVERVFTDHEVSLAQLLANQAASAVENARLYQRAQQEIAERMRAEEQIKASLKEKELLLKEIHHRVKNNLQVISSLLNLQSKDIQDPSTLEMFRESQNRVRSMALIHEKLYRSDDLSRIDFGEYVRNLAAFLVRSYRANTGPIALTVNAHDTYLGIDNAVPCGLIINELVSNALKHAFSPSKDRSPDDVAACPGGQPVPWPGGQDRRAGPGAREDKENEIHVELCCDQDDRLTLIVADNGVGFPPDLDFRNTQSLGMQLINTLVNQLRGTVELVSNGGVQFKITFPRS
jgi:two-component sensor histidine kinase